MQSIFIILLFFSEKNNNNNKNSFVFFKIINILILQIKTLVLI